MCIYGLDVDLRELYLGRFSATQLLVGPPHPETWVNHYNKS